MRRMWLSFSAVCLAALSACNRGVPVLPLENFWTGIFHSTVWGQFAIPFPDGSPSCDINPVAPETPAGWWALFPAITPSSDTVGLTVFADARCQRAQQTLYRSAMLVDLTGLEAKLKSPPATGRIKSASLHFNVIVAQLNSTSSSTFPCSSYIGGVGKISTLVPNASITQGASQVQIGSARFIQAAPATPINPSTVIGAFPMAGAVIADLSLANGSPSPSGPVTIMDTSPGLHAVAVNVTQAVAAAVNSNAPAIGFTVQSIGELPITLSAPPVRFSACRSWVQPEIFDAQFEISLRR